MLTPRIVEKKDGMIYETKKKNDLEHHGIKGQKWGIRRYQNKDGTLTKLGKKRLSKDGIVDPRLYDTYSAFTKPNRYQVYQDYLDTRYNSSGKWKSDMADEYVSRYASATLKDLELADTDSARKYVIDTIKEMPTIKSAYESARYASENMQKHRDDNKNLSENDKNDVMNIMEQIRSDGGYYGNTRGASFIRSTSKQKQKVEFQLDIDDGEDDFESALAANKFIKKYLADYDNQKESIAKYRYDDMSLDWWKEQGVSRDDFKRRMYLDYVRIDPKRNTFIADWSDGGTYGWHTFARRGDMRDLSISQDMVEG